MTREEAAALVQFVKDHDTRYEATAVDRDAESFVQLSRSEDGTRLDPIYSIEQYGTRHIEAPEATPTICEAWEQWLPGMRSNGRSFDDPAI